MTKCHPSWCDTCLPALEHCSSKGHHSSKSEANSFKFLWEAGIDIYNTSFTSQEGEGSMSCKAFSSTVGAVFVAWIKSPMTTTSQRNLTPGRQSRMKKKNWRACQCKQTQNNLRRYTAKQRNEHFDPLLPMSATVRRILYHSYCIMQETC